MKIKVCLLLLGIVCSFTILNAQCELTGPEFFGFVLVDAQGNCCVKVRPLAPVAQVNCQEQGCIGYWDWGDGNTTDHPCGAVYCYDCPGVYTVTHYVEGFEETAEMTFDLMECNDENCVEAPNCIDIQPTPCLTLESGRRPCDFCAFINIADTCEVAQILTTVSILSTGEIILTTAGYYFSVPAPEALVVCTQVSLTDGTQFEYCETFYSPCNPGPFFQETPSEKHIETDYSDKMTITPNPFYDYITISGLSFLDEEVQTIELINVNGQIVKKETTSISANYDLDTSTLNPGVYLIRVISKDGKHTYTQKMVKS